MRINDVPAGWSSTFNTVHRKHCRFVYIVQHDHNTTELCVTFSGVADLISRQLKPTAQLTTEHRKHEWENGRLAEAQGMAWFGFCFLASVHSLFSVCFFNGLLFDGRDNALEECWTESLYSTS
jgi:hypothetical protein